MDKETKNLDLTQRFIDGLKKHDLTLDEIQAGDWLFTGGDSTTKYYKHFLRFHPNELFPRCHNYCGLKDFIGLCRCVCGHAIQRHFMIEKGDQKLILGSCCIRKFYPNKMKRLTLCANCNCLHKNKSNNLCNNCRKDKSIKICALCLGAQSSRSKLSACDTCLINHCKVCKLSIKSKTEYPKFTGFCYPCYKK